MFLKKMIYAFRVYFSMAMYAFRGVFQNPCSRMGTKLKPEFPPPRDYEAEFNAIVFSLLPNISSAQYIYTSKQAGPFIIHTIFPQPLCFIQIVSYGYRNPGQTVSAQKVSGHKVSKICNIGQKVSTQKYIFVSKMSNFSKLRVF